MTATTPSLRTPGTRPSATRPWATPHRRAPARPLVLVGCAVALVLAVALSLSVGSRAIALPHVWELLLAPDGSPESVVVHGLRVPRTVLALVVGAALGVAGAVMQAVTRNPLADPGILGVNAGAGLAVVLAVAATGVSTVWFSLWFAMLGAAVAAVGVFLLGSAGHQAATPVRLALAGVAVAAALGALTQTVVLADQRAFDEFRFWVAGSLEGRGWDVVVVVAPFVAAGLVVTFAIGPALNALALGEETGAVLGVHVRRARLLAVVATTVLCGAATAAIGPVAFVGLAVPFAARALVGPDQRWVAPVCAVLGAVYLLVADVLARVVVAPQEVQVGIVAAIAGGPVFVAVVRRRKVAAL